MKWAFRVFSILVVGGLLFVIVTALRPRPVEVETATAVSAPLDQKIVDDGRARVRERYTVSAPLAGTLARIELHEGDTVDPGTVLARLLPLPSPLLDPRAREVAERRVASAEDGHRQAQTTLDRAVASAALAQRELDRAKELVSHEALPQEHLDQVTVDVKMRESEVESARFAEKVAAHGIDEARAALETFSGHMGVSEQLEVTSPVHGQVLHIFQKSEGVVAAGKELLEIGDPQKLELVVDVLSEDAVQIRPGMAARGLHWGGEPPITARVRRIEPAAFSRTSALGVEEQRVNVVLDLDGKTDQWPSLGDGFAVEIETTVWSKPGVLQVPTSALFRDGTGWAAFTVVNEHAALRSVEPGHRGALQTEILKGLSPGDQVIIHPGASVRAGVAVAAR